MNLHARYWRNHCLTSMPNDAVARPKTRLAIQSELMRIAVDGGEDVARSSLDAPEVNVAVEASEVGRLWAVIRVLTAISRKSTIISELNAAWRSGG